MLGKVRTAIVLWGALSLGVTGVSVPMLLSYGFAHPLPGWTGFAWLLCLGQLVAARWIYRETELSRDPRWLARVGFWRQGVTLAGWLPIFWLAGFDGWPLWFVALGLLGGGVAAAVLNGRRSPAWDQGREG